MIPMSKIVRTITNILYVFIIGFGFYVIIHGHLTPGGGFQGGAVVASVFALLAVAYGRKKIVSMLNKEHLSVAEISGLLAFICLAFLGLGTVFFFNFLAVGRSIPVFSNTPAGINPGDLNTAGILPLMNIAVGVEVLSALGVVILTMFLGFKEGK